MMTDFLGYVLGEYGHLIANEEGHSPVEQLQILHTKSQFCTAPTRALLLTTYIKWVNVFPEIKPQLINIFERYRHVLDSELQQRACEFYTLASRPDDDELLQNICEEIPPFPPRESALLSRLNKKLGATEDKRTWVHGGKDVNQDREAAKAKRGSTADRQTNESVASAAASDVLTSLQGLDLSGPSSVTSPTATAVASTILAKPTIAPHIVVGPNVDRWFERLTYTNDGVLYEDVQIQVGIKSRYQGHIGQLAVYMGNKVPVPLTAFTTRVDVDNPEALSITFAKMPATMVAPRSQSQQILHVECKKVFTTPPIMTISFLAGSLQTIALRLPVTITKFIEPVILTPSDYFERWRLIGGPPREAQSIFPINLTSSGELDHDRQHKVISGQKISVLPEVDPNPNNLVGAGVLHTSIDGKVGCLLRLEPNRDAKVRNRHQSLGGVFSDVKYLAALSAHCPEYIGGRSRGSATTYSKTAFCRCCIMTALEIYACHGLYRTV
jgi:AP-2 complex subunit alpha